MARTSVKTEISRIKANIEAAFAKLTEKASWKNGLGRLTAVFAVLALKGSASQDFMTVYAVVIAFYFGTQSQKSQDAPEDGHYGKKGDGNKIA